MIIGICGVKRCGKDTIANRICQSLPFTHKKIAEPLKHLCGNIFNWTPEQLEHDDKDAIDPRWNISPRAAMQFFGTEVMQYKIQELLPCIGRNFWITKLLSSHSKNIVISDLRFVHEYEMIKKINPQSIIIKVVRKPGLLTDPHVSEREWEDIKEDILVVNDGTLAHLHEKIDAIIARLVSS